MYIFGIRTLQFGFYFQQAFGEEPGLSVEIVFNRPLPKDKLI